MKDFLLAKTPYYYYGLLNEPAKQQYRRFLSALYVNQREIKANPTLSNEELYKIYDFISRDRPDLFWLSNRCSLRRSGSVTGEVVFLPKYRFNKEETLSVVTRIKNSVFFRELDRLLSEKQSDFEKALAAYEYIVKHADYAMEELHARPSPESIYLLDGIPLKGRAVCAGYAKTFQYFLVRHGVRCHFVTGKTKNSHDGMGHAWTQVCLDGDYYYVDPTWGDPVFSGTGPKDPSFISYAHFCVTDAMLAQSHAPVFDYKMPACTATKYNYFRYFNLLSKSYSPQTVYTQLKNALQKNQDTLTLIYETDEEYQRALRSLTKEGDLCNLAKRLKGEGFPFPSRIAWSYCDAERRLEIKLKEPR